MRALASSWPGVRDACVHSFACGASVASPATYVAQQVPDLRRAIGPGGPLDRGYHRAGVLFSQLNPPLIERIDVPDDALHVDLVLVPCEQAPEAAGLQTREQDQAARTVAGMHLVRGKTLDGLRVRAGGLQIDMHLRQRLTERERFRLRKAVG